MVGMPKKKRLCATDVNGCKKLRPKETKEKGRMILWRCGVCLIGDGREDGSEGVTEKVTWKSPVATIGTMQTAHQVGGPVAGVNGEGEGKQATVNGITMCAWSMNRRSCDRHVVFVGSAFYDRVASPASVIEFKSTPHAKSIMFHNPRSVMPRATTSDHRPWMFRAC